MDNGNPAVLHLRQYGLDYANPLLQNPGGLPTACRGASHPSKRRPRPPLWDHHVPRAHAVFDCELSLLLALTPLFSLIVSAFPDPTHPSIFNYKIIYLLFLPHREACGILVPLEQIEPGPKQ